MRTLAVLRRCFSTSSSFRRKISSNLWMERQLNDPYVEKAKMLNYRCRSAFKLIEIDDRFKILKHGQVVVDCGAAPGSWTQVAVNRVNADLSEPTRAKGVVVAIDKSHIHPIEGAIILGNSDFTSSTVQNRIREVLGPSPVDAVLSDMAPSATGIREMDVENIIDLCYSVLRFAVQVSKVDACLLVKLWQSKARESLEKDMSTFYRSVKVVKPNSSRADSAEVFLLGQGFKGLKRTG